MFYRNYSKFGVCTHLLAGTLLVRWRQHDRHTVYRTSGTLLELVGSQQH